MFQFQEKWGKGNNGQVFSYFNIGSQIFMVVGGWASQWGDYYSSTEIYTPSSGKWTVVGSLPNEAFGLQISTLNNVVFSFGRHYALHLKLIDAFIIYSFLRWSHRLWYYWHNSEIWWWKRKLDRSWKSTRKKMGTWSIFDKPGWCARVLYLIFSFRLEIFVNLTFDNFAQQRW